MLYIAHVSICLERIPNVSTFSEDPKFHPAQYCEHEQSKLIILLWKCAIALLQAERWAACTPWLPHGTFSLLIYSLLGRVFDIQKPLSSRINAWSSPYDKSPFPCLLLHSSNSYTWRKEPTNTKMIVRVANMHMHQTPSRPTAIVWHPQRTKNLDTLSQPMKGLTKNLSNIFRAT